MDTAIKGATSDMAIIDDNRGLLEIKATLKDDCSSVEEADPCRINPYVVASGRCGCLSNLRLGKHVHKICSPDQKTEAFFRSTSARLCEDPEMHAYLRCWLPKPEAHFP